MSKKIDTKNLGQDLCILRESGDYRGMRKVISDRLSLEKDLSIFELKVFLIKAAQEYFTNFQKREMVLAGLGLLEGYCCDVDFIIDATPSDVLNHSERITKYLQLGPYVRTKGGSHYSSYNEITDEDLANQVRNSFTVQVRRLLKELANFIGKIKNFSAYIEAAIVDPDIVVDKQKIRLPRQSCYLEDFPSPDAELYNDDGFLYGDGLNIDEDGITINWGDNTGGRPSYTRKQVENGILGDQIIFNTISDSPIGDEKCFVAVREDTGEHSGSKNLWHQSKLTVEDGKIYMLRLFVHNNNPNQTNALAKNVKAVFSIPGKSGKEIPVFGFIESSNASPSKYWHGVVLQAPTAMHLEYIVGTALLENHGLGANNGIKLSDDVIDIVTGKVFVDYDTLDGTVSGGYKYRSFITVRVKVVYDTAYTLETQVRLANSGDKTWQNSVEAQVGDIVEFRMAYKNNGTVDQLNIMINTMLPEGLRYIPGTTKLVNRIYPSGATIDQDDITSIGINIGSYASGANAFIRFQAEVVDEGLACGSNTLANWGQASVNKTSLQDYATVHLYKD